MLIKLVELIMNSNCRTEAEVGRRGGGAGRQMGSFSEKINLFIFLFLTSIKTREYHTIFVSKNSFRIGVKGTVSRKLRHRLLYINR